MSDQQRVMLMHPEQAKLFNQECRRLAWNAMMNGEVAGRRAFLEAIEAGVARTMLAENVRYSR